MNLFFLRAASAYRVSENKNGICILRKQCLCTVCNVSDSFFGNNLCDLFCFSSSVILFFFRAAWGVWFDTQLVSLAL